MGISVLFAAGHRGVRNALERYWPNLLHVQNYFGTNPLGQTWSLAVEEHFYLGLPVLLFVLTKLGKRGIHALPWICLLVMIACTAARVALNLNRPYDMWTHYFPTQLRIDGLACGVLLAYAYHFHPDNLRKIGRHRWFLLVMGLLLISPAARLDLFDSPYIWTVGFTRLYLGYGCILTAAMYTPVGRGGGLAGWFFATPLARLVAAIGLFSYSIYLWQMVLVVHPMEWLEAHGTLPNHRRGHHLDSDYEHSNRRGLPLPAW